MSETIWVEKEGEREEISCSLFAEREGVLWDPFLRFIDGSTLRSIVSMIQKGEKKKELSTEQLWLGVYHKEKILSPTLPDVYIRWISLQIGWGVFAARDFKEGEWIDAYSGLVRKKRRSDRRNGYCFEFVVSSGEKTPFTIDAQKMGGISRWINHCEVAPNLTSLVVTLHSMSHIGLVTARKIPAGSQLTYDYGPDYWSCRDRPLVLEGEK